MHALRLGRFTWIAALSFCLSAGLPIGTSSVATAQEEFDFNKLGEAPLAGAPSAESPVDVQAMFVPAQGNAPAKVLITAFIKPTWHIYSLTQQGDFIATKIVLPGGPGYKLTGEFKSSPAPILKIDVGEKTEQHEGMVTWWAPIEIDAGVDLQTLKIDGSISYQACSTGCIPEETINFSATVGDEASATELIAGGKTIYRAEGSPIALSGYTEPLVVTPGSQFKLVITADADAGWHIYPLANLHASTIAKPTVIALLETGGFTPGAITPQGKLETKETDIDGVIEKDAYYEQRVAWTMELTAPADAKAGLHPISGAIGFMTCKEGQCRPAIVANFQVGVSVEEATVAGKSLLALSDGTMSYTKLVAAAGTGNGFDADKIQAHAGGGSRSIFYMLGAALLGGLILNAMPCVLPVIGLKILGFVEQSHDHRSRVFLLNMWFSLGLVSVFLVLASLAVFLGMGWGEQFTKPWFTIGMSGLVFAMALSFLGVWEIPIPGFVGSGGAQQLASREGASGAFAKGVFTTLLATPCSGPFLGPLFGLLLRESPLVIYAVFACVGIGMASPYLLIGAFPQLIRVLPRPGAWMDTFKQLMAFVLLGTVVFLFMSIQQAYFIPTFALLISIWLGCWWIGRTPLTAELGTKLISWGSGAAMAGVLGWLSFQYLTPGKELLDWQPYSQQALVQLTSEGKTVFIDFTAEWCLTCKRNEKMAINTEPVKELVDELGVVTLKADWTDGSPEIKKMLALLGSQSIPVYAIFPADRPNQPIVLRDLVTQQQILDTLQQAGKSRIASAPKAVEKTAMMP